MAAKQRYGDRDWYVRELKEAGQVIIDRAEEIIGNIHRTTKIDIHIKVDQLGITAIRASKEILSIPRQ